GEIFSAVTSAMKRESIEEYAPAAFRLAEKAMKAGYPTVASMYVSAFGWAFKGEAAEKSKALVEVISKSGGSWFRPYEAESGEWKFVVEAFDKCLPTARRVSDGKPETRAKSGRIVWAARLAPVDRMAWDWDEDRPLAESVCYCSSLSPHFRGPRSPDDGSSDKPLTDKAFLSGKYHSIMTERDRTITEELQKTDSLSRWAKDPSGAAVEKLCGHDCVTIKRHDEKVRGMVCEAASFVRKDLPLAVESLPDGGLAITIEPWCQMVEGDHAIRQQKDGTFAFYTFPKAARATLEVFRAFGKRNGTIEIPKAGMAAMRPLLPRMAALAPIQGELSAVGGGADLERVPGDATPLARLSFEDGVLLLSLWTKPLEGCELVFVPGVGQPERMVAHKGRTAVLVRDLSAEKAASSKVRVALGEFEAWSDGENGWRIDDLVYALKALSALKELGDAVRLEWRKGQRISVAIPKPGSWKLAAVGGVDFWFSVSGEFKLDDGRQLALSELIAAFRNRKGEFVPLGENAFLRLTASLQKRLEALDAAGRTKGKGLEIPPAAIPMLDGVFGADDGGEMALPAEMEKRAEAVRAAFARKVEPPPRLKAELRPYQRDGYEWLSRLAACGMGACLADDMGLGKTLQVIALLLERTKAGASLVVAPASVCGNWRSEIARFAPTLRCVMAWDEKADSMDAVNAAGPGDVVIAGYGLLVSREQQFAAREWNGIVLDEAQAIKNESSKRAKAAKRLKAKFRIVATGTPVENRLSELWSISDFLNPGLLGTSGDFARRFTVDGRATPALKRLVSPLVLRRVKRDVLDDLPEKTEITIKVELGDDERAGYETCRRMALDTLEASGADNRISILAELTRLRRYCCHPSLVMGEAGRVSAKMDALVELLGNLRDNGHRALVFSQFTDYLAFVRRMVDEQGWTHCYLDGQTPAAERARLVDTFQRGEGDFFLISLKAGGTGLNLTAANYVILLDPWWNPAAENQAADRAHRIGQKNPVTVYRLIAEDTVEERVLELHKEKKALAEDVLGDAGSAALTPEQLMGLFGSKGAATSRAGNGSSAVHETQSVNLSVAVERPQS
ncbi:MAG: DEAD/DEAH box helicase, partial [Kiritimatiellae bacterium]|nr:DEAD/DEAH box helicase [Kiritimatiellia bacterium]